MSEKRVRGPVITDLADTKGLALIPSLEKSKDIAAIIKQKILKDEVDIFTGLAWLKKMGKIAEILTKDKEIKAKLEEEASVLLPVLGKRTVLGVRISESAYTRYDYSQCGHPELDAIDDLMRQLKSRKEQIEKELKLHYDEIEVEVNSLKKEIQDAYNLREFTTDQVEVTIINGRIVHLEKELELLLDTKFDTVVRKIPRLEADSSGEIVQVTAPIKNSSPNIRFTT